MTTLVTYERSSGVATLTLDSVHNRNALSLPLVEQLHDHVRQALGDPAVRVIVLTGTGPVFCAGADLREQQQPMTAAQRARGPRLTTEIMTAMWESPKPIVGRINGHVRGGGLGFVGACDIAVAARSATFAFPEVRLGVVPAVVAVTVLPRLTPRAAAELLLTGEPFDAPRAVEVGLLTLAVDPQELDGETARYCEALRLGGPEALAETKRLTRGLTGLPIPQAFTEMRALSLERFASDEAREGLAAAREHRRPRWTEEPA